MTETERKNADFCPNKNTLLAGKHRETVDCDDKLIMKLFSKELPRELIEDEMRINNLIVDKGIRAPRIKGIREYEGKLGLVYDKIPGVTLLEWLLQHLDMTEALSAEFARIHHRINDYEIPELLPMKESLRSIIVDSPTVPHDIRGQVLTILDSLPDAKGLCHGDFHPDNIILTSDGRAIIDWIRATKGYFLADVERTCLILELWLPWRIKTKGMQVHQDVLTQFREVYVSEYLGLCGRSREELEDWRAPVAAARLADEVPGERKRLLEIIRERI